MTVQINTCSEGQYGADGTSRLIAQHLLFAFPALRNTDLLRNTGVFIMYVSNGVLRREFDGRSVEFNLQYCEQQCQESCLTFY